MKVSNAYFVGVLALACADKATSRMLRKSKKNKKGIVKPVEVHTAYDNDMVASSGSKGERAGYLHISLEGLADTETIDVQLFSDETTVSFTKQELVNNPDNQHSYWFGESGNASINMVDMGTNETNGEPQIFASLNYGDKIYHVAPIDDYLSEVIEIDTFRFPPEVEPVAGDEEDLPPQIFDNGGQRHLQASPQPVSIGVMVVWTMEAECANAGLPINCQLNDYTKAKMRGIVNLAVAETNRAFALSGIVHRLDLVHAYRHPTYKEPEVFQRALHDLKNGAVGGVQGNRETHGADLVTMMINHRQYCGAAYLGPAKSNSFSVTNFKCATGYYSFGHELAHNLGCNHDRGTSGQCGNNKQTNFGYRDPAGKFRSIMAYNCRSGQCDNNAGGGCTRVQRFSNPNIKYGGFPMGTKDTNNAQQINAAGATVAAFYSAGSTPLQAPPLVQVSTPTQTPTGNICSVKEIKNDCKKMKDDGCKWNKNNNKCECQNKNNAKCQANAVPPPPPPPPPPPQTPPPTPPPPPPPQTPPPPPQTPPPTPPPQTPTGNLCSVKKTKNECKNLKDDGCKWNKNNNKCECQNKNNATCAKAPPVPAPGPAPGPAPVQNQNSGGGGSNNNTPSCSSIDDKDACKKMKEYKCKWDKNDNACKQK